MQYPGQPPYPSVEMEQNTVIYKTTFTTLSSKLYEKDLKKRQKAGWQLVSCNQTGQDVFRRPILTAIYQRPKKR